MPVVTKNSFVLTWELVGGLLFKHDKVDFEVLHDVQVLFINKKAKIKDSMNVWTALPKHVNQTIVGEEKKIFLSNLKVEN